jgi:hypothetical protein
VWSAGQLRVGLSGGRAGAAGPSGRRARGPAADATRDALPALAGHPRPLTPGEPDRSARIEGEAYAVGLMDRVGCGRPHPGRGDCWVLEGSGCL